MRHFHRNGHTITLDGKLYYGVSESKYLFVSQDGTFISPKYPNGEYRGSLCSNGYRQICINDKMEMAHRVVYEVCTGIKIGEDFEVDHIDTDRQNNSISNLRVVTRSENVKNAITYGRHLETLKKAQKRLEDSEVRKAANKKISKALSKRIVGTELKSGKVVEFDSLKEAELKLGFDHSMISTCCSGKIKQTHGWRFRYK